MKKIFLLYLILLNIGNSIAQTPQITVVKLAGNSTTIFSDLPSAYNFANDGDIIYLPGGIFSFIGDSISKKLRIVGAGFGQDSTSVTGKTVINTLYSTLSITSSSSSGTILEGLRFNTNYNSGGSVSLNLGNNISILSCKISGNVGGNNSLLKDCVVDGIIYMSSSLIRNCIIGGYITSCQNSQINNCIFIYSVAGYEVQNSINCTFNNNIFITGNSVNSNNTNCYFYNNIKVKPYIPSANEFNTILVDSISQIFESVLFLVNPFNETLNYELKSTCIGKNGGNDGTDVGIYGSSNPCKKGWVPSNPHIYFKQVQGQTSADGRLQINFKVRAGN